MCVGGISSAPIITAPPRENVTPPINTGANFDLGSVAGSTRPKVYNQPPTPTDLGNQTQPSTATVSTNTEDGITPNTVTFNRNRGAGTTSESSLTSPELAQRLDPAFLNDFNAKTQDGVLDAGELSDLYRRANSIQNNDTKSASKSFLDEVIRNNNGQPIPIDVGSGQRNITISNTQNFSISMESNKFEYGPTDTSSKPVSLEFNSTLRDILSKASQNGFGSITDQDLALLNNSRRANRSPTNVERALGYPSNVNNSVIDQNETLAYNTVLEQVRFDREGARPASNTNSDAPTRRPSRSTFAINGTYESTTIRNNNGNRFSIGIADKPTAGLNTSSTSSALALGYERTFSDNSTLGIYGGVIANSTTVTVGNLDVSAQNRVIAFGNISYTNGDTAASLSFNQRVSGDRDPNYVGDVTFSLSRGDNSLNIGLESRGDREYGVISTDYRITGDAENNLTFRGGVTSDGGGFLSMKARARF
ncbi:MAG: hypothetical protein U0457_06005 [Candidatus Sericytochromatia bacterium]